MRLPPHPPVVAAGIATVVLSLTAMVLLPLVGLLPELGGPVVWLVIGGVGLLALAVAASLERGREGARNLRHRARELTEGWE